MSIAIGEACSVCMSLASIGQTGNNTAPMVKQHAITFLANFIKYTLHPFPQRLNSCVRPDICRNVLSIHILAPMRFPLILGLGLIIGEALLALLLWQEAPTGTRWLGDTMQNSSDAAVYLSYLRQGADGYLFIKNLYAVEPNVARFDLVWSTLGLIARSGISPLLLQEMTRWVFTSLLAISLFAAARSVATSDRDARLTTILAFGGIGTGWLYSIWLGVNHAWSPLTYAAPDVVTEFAVAPILLGGVHMILSLALLVTALRYSWQAFASNDKTRAVVGSACAALLFLFHPYFVPLLSVFWLVAIGIRLRHFSTQLLPVIAICTASLIPAFFIYLPLFFDPTFRAHHVTTNALPLAPLLATTLMLIPFAGAGIWRIVKKVACKKEERWILAWLCSVLICLTLPFPWKRKLTEGLEVALVFLTMPAWLAIADWIRNGPVRVISILTGSCLLLGAWLTPLHLFVSHLIWIDASAEQRWFYRPTVVFDAWEFLHAKSATSSIVISDDAWVNVWTPAYAGRMVWVAHDHETPDFATKRAAWRRLLETDNPTEARDIISRARITHLLVTSSASLERFRMLFGDTWIPIFKRGEVSILVRFDPTRNLSSR
jgi:hypothetical protein